jgi:peptide/nickel transport system substrate-binding protein
LGTAAEHGRNHPAMRSASSFWDRYARRRVTRRLLLRAAATASVATGAVALAGCGGSKKGSSATSPPTSSAGRPDAPDILNPGGPPRPGGRYVTANSANFGSWDPHTGIQVASAYFPRIYNLLLSQSPTKPDYTFFDLATSYETPDDLTYIFKIRPGVKVAPNGLGVPERDIDGEDVRATFERLKTDAATNQYSFASKYVDAVSVGPDTVTITTTEPYAWFVNRVSSSFNTIPPRELLSGDPSRLGQEGAGGGPYKLVAVTENDVARFVRNPGYYRTDGENGGARLPYVDELEVRVIFDRATQRTAFRSDQTQQYWAESGVEAHGMGDYPIAREPVFAYISFTMNPARKPFDDPRVRRAVSRAINRQQFVDRVYGGDARANGLVHWPLGSYALPDQDLASTYQPHDPQEARQLAEAAGGITLKMTYPANTTIQEHGQHLSIFVEQMRQAGIEVDQQPQEFSGWVTSYRDLQYDSSLALNQIYETPELPLLFHTTGGPFGDRTYIQGLGDAGIDAAVVKANTTLDFEARKAAVHDAQRVIYAKDPMYLPFVSPYLYMVFSKQLKNIPTGVGTTQYSLTTYWLDV